MNCPEDYCPVNPISKEELEKEVSQRMARYNESERVAIGNMISNTEWSMELEIAWNMYISW